MHILSLSPDGIQDRVVYYVKNGCDSVTKVNRYLLENEIQGTIVAGVIIGGTFYFLNRRKFTNDIQQLILKSVKAGVIGGVVNLALERLIEHVGSTFFPVFWKKNMSFRSVR